MTLDQALALRVGDYVLHSQDVRFNENGDSARRPIRVTAIWVNEKRTIVRVRLGTVAAILWLDAEAYDLPPVGQVFDRTSNEWITPAELKTRKRQRIGVDA